MSPEELRSLRERRGLTRDQLASDLGGCTAQAIVKWERGERPIPSWVEEKMLRNMQLEFPLEEVNELLHLAKEAGMDFKDLLIEAARHVAASRAQGKPEAPTVKPGPATSPNVVIAHSLMPITTARERSIAAEEAAPYQAKKTKTSSPGQRPA